jgi:hypothetical protein
MASTLEDSTHTSIQKRKLAVKPKRFQPQFLMHFVGNPRQPMHKFPTFSLQGYYERVDITGRCICKDKVGYIEYQHSHILTRLGLDAEQWLCFTTEFEKIFVMRPLPSN